MKRPKQKQVDSQLIELVGRNWLMSQLQQAGVEVAKPERDRGVDLIAYLEHPRFVACPIQLKVSSKLASLSTAKTQRHAARLCLACAGPGQNCGARYDGG
jgi:hypothetical protein